MPEFRKCIIALAGVALFAGLASAQVGTPGTTPSGTAFTCGTTNGSVTPTLRAEGYTELTGDMVMVYQVVGAPLALGSVIPTANLIFLNGLSPAGCFRRRRLATLLKRCCSSMSPARRCRATVPAIPQTLCTTPAQGAAGVGGCTEWSVFRMSSPVWHPWRYKLGVPVSVNPNTAVSLTTPQPPGANIFQGIISGNSVTFFGVPVLAPTTSGLTRVFHITDIRANADQIDLWRSCAGNGAGLDLD